MYEGVLTPVTFFLATVVKLGVFAFFVRVLFFLLGTKLFLFFWQPVFLFVAAASIVFGALGALVQTKIKRFIGYTSINQMGYLLVGVSSGDTLGLQAAFLHLNFYLVAVLSFFSVILYYRRPDTGCEAVFISQLSQLGRHNWAIAVVLSLTLFSMAGVPPLAGFFGKFFLFFSAFKAGNHSLLLLALVTNVISAFYYLRIVKCIFFEAPKNQKGAPIFVCFFGPSGRDLLYDAGLAAVLLILILSPFFLNGLLAVFGAVAVQASFLCIPW